MRRRSGTRCGGLPRLEGGDSPGPQTGGVEKRRGALLALLGHLGRCFFGVVFSMLFLIDFGSFWAPKIDQKSIPNRSKMGVKRDAKNHDEKSRIPKPFWDDFS